MEHISELLPTEIPQDLQPTTSLSLQLNHAPQAILAEAQKAAQALKDVISRKAKPVRFNGEQYLEFEDWQTVARFYGVAVKVVETKPVDFGDARGFEARAVAIHFESGREISAADSMCLNDERNWNNKPLFQVRSMAQTRACAKALRNIFAWVVVLAGYKPTPAEEMAETPSAHFTPEPEGYARPQKVAAPVQANSSSLITDQQRKRIFALCTEYGVTHESLKKFLIDQFKLDSTNKIPMGPIYDQVCKWIQAQTVKSPEVEVVQ